ncbi:MAG: type III-B CRISPR module-associated Cmr3 family protein, partial [Thermoanaerobaculia bacterium]
MSSESWTPLQAVADDILFFRDGKPSSLGADHYLRSLFPPYPSTIYGALRTRRLLDAGVPLDRLAAATWVALLGSLVDELGAWGGFGSLALRGPWLVRNGEVLLPAPADLALLVDRKRRAESFEEPALPRVERVFRLQRVDEDGARWSHPLALIEPHEWTGTKWRRWPTPPEPEPESAAGWFLTSSGFRSWSGGGVPEPQDFVPTEKLWVDEARVGLGIADHHRMAKEHMLYTFGYVRLRRGVAIGFEVAGTKLAVEGHIRLGGDGRTARIAAGPQLPFVSPPPLGTAKRFRLYLATPTLSAAGGYPPGFAAGSLDGSQELPYRLVAAAVPGFALAGGWDVAQGRAKPLRRVLPAGSVFFFEGRGVNDDARAAARLHATP